MDRSYKENKNLLLHVELLKAKLEIRNFYLKSTVKEIYENIGQILSLVRIQLALVDKQTKEETNATIASSGKLVSQSIHDLRALSKSFYPDVAILNNQNFIASLEEIIEIFFPDKKVAINVKGKIQIIQAELRLLTINILREIFILVQQSAGEILELEIAYHKESVKITVVYEGLPIQINTKTTDEALTDELTLAEKITLINARVKIEAALPGKTEIKLLIPLKLAYT
jgi:nitrate/nitrite-specific signal transduction histidine kinase